MAVTFMGDYDGERRLGTARPSALMFTAGVGSIVELPHTTVIVRGIDAWDDRDSIEVNEPRLLGAVRARLGDQVARLMQPPHAPEDRDNPTGGWSRIGVPVMPFPRWLRCTKCNYLGPMDSDQFKLDTYTHNVDLTRFLHTNCQRSTNNKGSLAVSARFVFACESGHLDEFPYPWFVHDGNPCARPRYEMRDFGRGLGPDVTVKCTSCGKSKPMVTGFGKQAAQKLPACRGRHPQLGIFDKEPCRTEPRTMVLGASNLWFSQVFSSLYLPHEGGDLHTKVRNHWSVLSAMDDAAIDVVLPVLLKTDDFLDLREHQTTAIKAAMLDIKYPADAQAGEVDLKKPEWDAFTRNGGLAPGDSDFRLKPVTTPGAAQVIGVSKVVLVERLREAKAFVGFTRIGMWDPDDIGSKVRNGRLTAYGTPKWVPAVDARGEGVFLQFDEDFISAWENRCRDAGTLTDLLNAHRSRNRRIGLTGANEYRGWIGERGVLLHTLAHALIRQMALDCGYSAQSLAERIYSGTPEDRHAGILIYTTAADSEGTLGGLVRLGEPDILGPLIQAALTDAAYCSADPLCAEHRPNDDLLQLHGAACHLCSFAAETTCEYNNRYLDRSVLALVGPNPTPISGGGK